MKTVNQKKRKRRAKSRAWQHKVSILAISGVIVLLAIIVSVACVPLHKKNNRLKAQEATLEEQLQEQDARAEEIEELEDYVGTDEYVEDVAKEKLGLINENEILFQAEP